MEGTAGQPRRHTRRHARPASHARPEHAGCHLRTLAHTASLTTWHGHHDSLQHRYTPSATHTHTHTHARTHSRRRPLRPGPGSWRGCRAYQLQPCQRPLSSRAGFFQPEPRSLYCKLWKSVSDVAAPARCLFTSSFLPSAEALRSGELQAESCRVEEAERTEGETAQEPPARPRGP